MNSTTLKNKGFIEYNLKSIRFIILNSYITLTMCKQTVNNKHCKMSYYEIIQLCSVTIVVQMARCGIPIQKRYG